MPHACDLLFLFLHRADEHERIGKLMGAIKETFLSHSKPIHNVLNYMQTKKLLLALIREENWKSQECGFFINSYGELEKHKFGTHEEP